MYCTFLGNENQIMDNTALKAGFKISFLDDYRIEYMRLHIEQMKKAIEDGVELMGYTMWSPIDIVSSGTGEMKKRYGLIYVNKNDDGTGDYARIRKKSFYWYKELIQSNGKTL